MSNSFVEVIDTEQFGLPRAGAVFAIRGSRPVLIEAGTPRTATRLLNTIGDLSPEYVFVTHIHLDHAGGAGQLAQEFPRTKIVVHERGYRHLADPGRLIDGVRSASPDLFPLYGEPLPVPEHQLLSVIGGEMFDLGQDVRLEVLATPGHAPHHICLFEHNSRTLYAGDAVGNWNNPVDVPLTVPPRFDLAKALATLEALKRLRPERLAFTHFGIANHALVQLDRYEERLLDWFETLRELSRSKPPAEVVKQVLSQPKYASLLETQRSMVAMSVHGALLSLEAGTA